MRKLILIMLATAALVFGCVACSSSDNPGTPTPGSFDEVIATGGEFETVTTKNEETPGETVLETVGNEDYFCTTTHYSVIEAPGEFPQFDPNAEVIFPGNLLQGNSLGQSTPNPIPVRRGGGRVVMTILNGSSSVSRDIPVVSLGSILDAQNDIIANASNTVPARFTFTLEEVRSHDELALALDVSAQNLVGSVDASLDFHTDHDYHRFVVKLVQSYFTMAFEIPTAVEDFFAANVTPAELDPFVGPGNPPAFISSVTYGRIFYLLVESTATSTEIEASIDASLRTAVAGGSLGVDATYLSELENVQISAYALGGESESAIGAITTDFETLKAYLAQGGQIDTGVPLSYVVRSVAHRDRIVRVGVASEYDLTQCVPVGESFENPIFWYRADQGTSRNGSNHLTRWANSFADPTMDATLPAGISSAGTWITGAINGQPAVRFGGGAGSFGNSLAFPGLDFAHDDYTVLVVARTVSSSMNYPTNVLFGGGANQRTSLEIGFRNPSQVSMGHLGPRLDAPVSLPLTGFQLYTFRFSRTEGMTVWVGGAQNPVAQNPALTSDLLEYIGARLGSSTGSSVDIAEIKAYGQAVNDAQRAWLVEQLLVKYAL
ncbi:MAG TPA: thiol-activated cytolysin family protein [Candidatus Krumholzibacteria bacterium]|nr:thiol-activated cytolysin family protein [Candidatus Krumholzibacteria bacterium]